MRTIARAVTTTVGIALACSGCSASSGGEATVARGSAGDTDLLVWTDALKVGAVRQVADAFAEEYGVTVEVQVVATDLQSNFVTANAAGNGPDVVTGAHDWIGNLVENGAIVPLPMNDEGLSRYDDVAVDAVTYRDRVYALPYGIEALVLYRNTAMVSRAPRTLQEAFESGKQAVQSGGAQSAFNLPVGQVGDAYHMQPLYTSMGGYIFQEGPDGTADPATLGLDQPGAVDAAKKIAALGEEGSKILQRSISSENSIALFADGKAAYLVSGPWALAQLDASEVDYDVSPIPGFAGQQPAQPFAGVQAFYVASNGDHPALAMEFVTNAADTEQAMQTMYDLADLPPAMKTVQRRAVADNSDLRAFITAAQRGNPMPAIPEMEAVFQPLGQAYAAIVGGAPPARTMRQAGQTINDFIAR